MSIDPSESHGEFCDEVRAFVSANLPEEVARKVAADQLLKKEDYLVWQRALGQRGWLAYTWPSAAGGPGWSAIQQFLFEGICAEMNTPPIVPFGTRMAGPIIREFGTEWQKERFLEPIRRSSEWWCQGYSEPSAGSDLASLSTRAELKGDKYVINGQKIWTSWAHYADWMFCLVRTSQEDRPQKGITFLLVDMRSPGVDVQPIRSLDGTHSYNSVFLTDVEVPITQRVGEEGQGWNCAKFLLSLERLDNASVGLIKRALRKLVVAAEASDAMSDPVFQLQLADIRIRLRALELLGLGVLADASQGKQPGPEVSAIKIRSAELFQFLLELTMKVSGYHALPYDEAMIFARSAHPEFAPAYAAVAAPRYFNRRAVSIFGGTTEIQKNILAKRVLGL
jgi:alkylation response protein AidB-like acyl-CoA dehydrogenase